MLVIVDEIVAALGKSTHVETHILPGLGWVGHTDGAAERERREVFIVILFAAFDIAGLGVRDGAAGEW